MRGTHEKSLHVSLCTYGGFSLIPIAHSLFWFCSIHPLKVPCRTANSSTNTGTNRYYMRSPRGVPSMPADSCIPISQSMKDGRKERLKNNKQLTAVDDSHSHQNTSSTTNGSR